MVAVNTSFKKIMNLGDVTCGIIASFQTLGLIGSLAYKQETKYTNHILNLFLYINIKFCFARKWKVLKNLVKMDLITIIQTTFMWN